MTPPHACDTLDQEEITMRLSPTHIVTALAASTLGACASGPLGQAGPLGFSGPPSVASAPGVAAPPQARFYADCIAAAAAARTYDKEPDANLLRFTCTGTPARVFYDGLGPYSAQIGSEIVADGRTWRFSQKLVRNPWGVDGCSADGMGEYRCTVVLNVGEYLSF